MERQGIAPSNSVKVRVFEITSMTDPETNKPGKNIKLVQVKQQRPQQSPSYYGSLGDPEMLNKLMGQIQSSLGVFSFGREGLPKINLFLSESEYDLLGVRFEVNEVYDMILKDGTIRFQKSLEGV